MRLERRNWTVYWCEGEEKSPEGVAPLAVAFHVDTPNKYHLEMLDEIIATVNHAPAEVRGQLMAWVKSRTNGEAGNVG